MIGFRQISVKKITMLLVVLLLISVSAGYYFSWRPADESYDNATTKLDAINNMVDKTDNLLSGATLPADIDINWYTELKGIQITLKQSISDLNNNKAITRDMSVSSSYTEFRSEMSEYMKDLNGLSTSLGRYLSISQACAKFVNIIDNISDSATFDTISATCNDAIDSAGSAPDSSFKTQYLTTYAQDSKKLFEAYRLVVDSENSKASLNAVTQAKLPIIDNKDTTLDITISKDPSGVISNLLSILKSQRSVMIR